MTTQTKTKAGRVKATQATKTEPTTPAPKDETKTEPATPAEPTTKTEPATPAEPKKVTKAEAEQAFEQAFVAAVDEGSDDRIATLEQAFGSVPGGPKARTAVQAVVAQKVMQSAFAEGDTDRALRANTLASNLKADLGTKAVEKGPDLITVLEDRITAVAILAYEVATWATEKGLDAASSLDQELLDAFAKLAGLADEGLTLEQVFGPAFARKAPNLDKVRGASGGGGTAARPADAMDSFDVGTVLTTTYSPRGSEVERTFDATVVEVDGHHKVEVDGTTYGSPTSAANAALATHPDAPNKVSMNGWGIWKVGARTLGDAYAAKTA